MAQLAMHNIHKHYGDVHAVKGVSLDIPSGEFVVLVGPSGCGKSTLLRAIAGLESVSDGRMTIDGRDVTLLAPKRRNIAMVFQSYALYPYLTVYENIAFGLRARKSPAAQIDERVNWAAQILEISEHLQRRPGELSGGQRQRVAIGRAIVREANLFLFDEPLSNLDAKLRDGMREEIKRLHQQLGKTFIYVTHDQIEAMTLADRIVLLQNGEIAQSGTPLDLFERPANRFVAGFLGSPSMNFLTVRIAADGAAMALSDGQAVPIPPQFKTDGVVANRTLTWGVRPEHFQLVDDDRAMIDATLDIAQPTGSRTYVSFYLGGDHAIAEVAAAAITQSKQKLRFAVAVERTVLFDPDTGIALTGG